LPSARAIPDTAKLDDKPVPLPNPFADAPLFATSGSTAASKIVAQSHYNAAVNTEALQRHHGLAPGDRVLGCLPIHHVNGVHFTLFATVASGAHAFLAPQFDPSSECQVEPGPQDPEAGRNRSTSRE
jgi:acyl-CoA synthetase (AMP-forming)/AMP-acid ligase II